MFKLTLKLTIASVAMIGVFLAASSTAEVAAATCSWAPGNPNNPPAMGYHHGEADDNFSGLVVKAYVGPMTNGQPDDTGHGGQLVNTGYMLHSRLPDPGVGNHYFNPGDNQNVNARIFTLNSNGQPVDRTDVRTFRTGETLYGPGSSYSCDGFSALGPGTYVDEIGNRFAIDCGQEILRDGTNAYVTKAMTNYWIDSLPSAFNQSGYWQIKIKDKNGNVTNTYDGRMAYSDAFQVANGDTKYIDLVWHKEPKVPPVLPSSGTCASLTVANNGSGNSNRRRVWVEVDNISMGKLRTYNSSGQVTGTEDYPNDPADPTRPRSIRAWVGAGGNPADGANGLGPGESAQSKTWNFVPWDSNSIHVKVVVEDFYDTDDPGTAKSWNVVNVAPATDQVLPCYSIANGRCTINDVWGDGPNRSIVTPGQVYFSVSITNTSADGLQLWNPSLVVGGTTYTSDHIVPVGQSHEFTGSFGAPGYSATNTANFVFTPQYFAGVSLGACSTNRPVYQYFNIDPHAEIINTNPENPTTVTYKSGGTLLTGPPVTVNTHSELNKQGAEACPSATDAHDSTDTYGSPPDHVYNYANGCINAGDRFCARTTISPASGYRGPSGYADINPVAATKVSSCVTTVNEPYVHFAGSGVSAGGGFGDNCTTNTTGGIYTYVDTAGARAEGSGSQFGAQALGVIQGLSSANLRGSAPIGLTGLTFSNSTNLSGSPPGAPNVGGKLGLSSNCVPDYFSKKPNTVTNNDPLSTSASVGTDGAQYYKPNGGTLTIGTGSIGPGKNEIIYVEGNVRITGTGITYTGSRSNPADVQSLYIVVKGGNIYIDPSVTQLDGVYVAQPDGTTGGKITTCGNGAGFYSPNSLYDSCKQQLVVNGSFVAQQVFLDRTHSSLRFSQGGEHIFSGGSHSCGRAGRDILGSVNKLDCAAEVFNFSPELYLAQPASNPTSGPATGKYDYITSLSPVL